MNENTNIIQISRLEKVFSNRKLFWQTVNSIFHKKILGFNGYVWDESTFIPVSIWEEQFHASLKDNFSNYLLYDLDDPNYFTALISSIMTISSWRYSMGCYIINEYVKKAIFNQNIGSTINKKRINNIREWTIYIPQDSLTINNTRVHGIYVHKNSMKTGIKHSEPDVLIISFNIEVSPSERHYSPLPCIVLDISSDSIDLTQCIKTFWGIAPEYVLPLLHPIMSLLNLIGDESTVIESEIVGIKRPDYRDVEVNLNFNELNVPTYKLAAPSNTRIWKVGTNFMTEHKRLSRLNPLNIIIDLHWENNGDLVLVRPTSKSIMN